MKGDEKMEIVVQEDLKKEIEMLKKITETLNEVKESTQQLQFITIREFAKITGISEPTVQEIFRRPDFPSCDYGKSKIAEINAVRKYFSVPRRKEVS